MILFAVPFAAVGVVMIVLTARSLAFAYKVTMWTETPATIVSTALDGQGGKSSCEARASYRYVVDGRTHTGYRVSIHGGRDNIGSFQRTAYAELRQHQESGRPFRCFVNPLDPGDAVLYRDPRWGLILFKAMFGVVFGGVGFGLMAGAVYGRRCLAKEAELKARYPGEPWRWDPAWASGSIRSSGRAEMLAPLIFAALWNAVAIPVTFLVFSKDGNASGPARLIVLVFPLAGAGLAAWAVMAVSRYVKYGVSVLTLSRVPGVIGGPLLGAVQAPVRVEARDGFRVALRCVHRYTTGSGKNRNTHEVTLWEDERVILREVSQGGSARSTVPVVFGIPRNCQPTRTSPADDQVVWRVEVNASTPGVDYASRFEVPVFVTPDSRDDFRLDEGLIGKYEKPYDPEAAFRENGIRVEGGAGRRTFVFPAARHKGTACMLTLFAVAWTGIVAAMWRGGAPLPMTVIFGLVDVAVLWGVLVLWLESRRMEVGAGEILLRGAILGMGRTHRLKTAEVADVTVERGMQSGNRSYYTLKLRVRDGRSRTIGARILGMHTAEQLAAEIRKQIAPSDGHGARQAESDPALGFP